MRRKLIISILGTAFLLGSALAIQAKDLHPKDGVGRPLPEGQMSFRQKGCPPPWLDILGRIDLSDDQWKSVRQLLDKDQANADKQRTRMRAAERELRQAMKPQQFDEKRLRTCVADKAAIEADLLVGQTKTLSSIYQLLTAEQKELFDLAGKLRTLQGQEPAPAGPPMPGQPKSGRPGSGRPAPPDDTQRPD